MPYCSWLEFNFEKRPWSTLTLVVLLEAIFLSTFVIIGQNRQAARQLMDQGVSSVSSSNSLSMF